jgi:NADH-ubiquinone oxidoreductase chain 1
LRSTAQLISYELILSSAILLVILLSGNLNLTINIETQKIIQFIFPLLPIFIIFFIGCIAETESELVSGFMTEHSAVIFVFFFLAEYASIVLICIFTSILFLGGYLKMVYFGEFVNLNILALVFPGYVYIMFKGAILSITLGLKTCLLIFVFI